MNNTRSFLLLIGISVLGFCYARAAGEIVHTVDFPKGDAAWSVTFEVPPPAPGAPTPAPASKPAGVSRSIRRIDIVREGNLRRDRISWSDGNLAESWWTLDPPLVLLQDGNSGRVFVRKAGNMADQQYDASLFDWVNANNFVEMQSYKGKKARHYQREIVLADGEKQVIQAWIDDDTSRPVAWSNGELDALFSFDAPMPADPLVLPEKYQAEFKRVSAFFARRT